VIVDTASFKPMNQMYAGFAGSDFQIDCGMLIKKHVWFEVVFRPTTGGKRYGQGQHGE
jgi:hypothetical protein